MSFLKRNIPWLVVAALLCAGAIWLKLRPVEAEVVKPARQQMAEILAASGQVRGRNDSRLAPETTGTVKEILVREGQAVTRGTVLLRLDTERLEAQLRQAGARVDVAQAQLEVAARPPLASEFSELRAQNDQAVARADAALESARQQLLESQRGPRPEQISQARAELEQTKVDSDQKRRERVRQEELYRRGAVSKQAYEQALAASREAQAAQERARQKVAELENGTRPEQIARNRESVESAEADLVAARKTGQAKLRQLEDRPRPEDVALAESQLAEARAAFKLAQEQVAQAVVTAPYDGTVGRILLRPGDLAGPNSPVLTFASSPTLEVRIELDESERSRVKKGMTAEVRASGYPEPFEATVEEFSAEIDSVKGTLETRLWVKQPPSWLLPGQTVDVNIVLSPQADRILVPLTSVMLETDSASLFVVEGSRVQRKSITISSPSIEGYLVQSGLTGEEAVIRFPQSFEEGQTVRAKLVEMP